MRAVLKLEFIAENYFAYKRRSQHQSEDVDRHTPLRYADYLGRDASRPWVAQLTGRDKQFGFARTFVSGQIDYSQANSTGSRGVFLYYPLRDGVYEVNERTSWRSVRRYFLRVENGHSREIQREEVERCLPPPKDILDAASLTLPESE